MKHTKLPLEYYLHSDAKTGRTEMRIDIKSEYEAKYNAMAIAQYERLVEALKLVRSLIVEGAETGFNPTSGDWAEKLYKSQAVTFAALDACEVG